MQRYLKWRYRPWIGFRWLSASARARREKPLEAQLRAQQRRRRYPNLMFHFLRTAPCATTARRRRRRRLPVHIGPIYSTRAAACGDWRARSGEATSVRLPVDRAGPPRVGRAIPAPSRDVPEPAGDRATFNAGETSPGPGSPPTRRSAAFVAKDERDRPASLLHRRAGGQRRERRRPPAMATPGPSPAGRGHLGDALRHERQHLHPGDDDGGEGRRPDNSAPRRSNPNRRSTPRLSMSIAAAWWPEVQFSAVQHRLHRALTALRVGIAGGLAHALGDHLTEAEPVLQPPALSCSPPPWHRSCPATMRTRPWYRRRHGSRRPR